MRIVIRPVDDPSVEIEVTHRLTAAIAEALYERRGGNDVLNWLEAERHLARLMQPPVDGVLRAIERGPRSRGREGVVPRVEREAATRVRMSGPGHSSNPA